MKSWTEWQNANQSINNKNIWSMRKFIDYIPSVDEALPGTKENSDIRGIYKALASGRSLTALDAVFSNHTVCLGKYISILKTKYNIPIKDEWVTVGDRQKRVKRFWLEIVHS